MGKSASKVMERASLGGSDAVNGGLRTNGVTYGGPVVGELMTKCQAMRIMAMTKGA
jgi:hypothetical protein